MSSIPVFGILTDFGFDFAVASMKAVLVKDHPQAQIIDIDHTVHKFSRVSAAFIIDKTYRYFPHGSIFICVVDPGVGSKREAICIETETYTFFGPNNGLFDYILKEKTARFYQINENILTSKSSTFHGRDLFIPAASAYAKGQRHFLLPLSKKKLVHFENDAPVIAYIDSFGNIKTTIAIDATFSSVRFLFITINGGTYQIPLVKTFSDTKPGTLLCYKGSNETLEIAVNLGSAQHYLHAKVGDKIEITLPQKLR